MREYYTAPAARSDWKAVVRWILDQHDVTWVEMQSKTRTSRIVDARFDVAWMLRHRGWSYPMIAKAIGREDHTTAFHAVRRKQEALDEGRVGYLPNRYKSLRFTKPSHRGERDDTSAERWSSSRTAGHNVGGGSHALHRVADGRF